MVASGALIIATPISAAAHDNRGGERSHDDHDRHISQRSNDDSQGFNGRHRGADPASCEQWQTRLNEWVAQYKSTSQKDIAFGASYYAMVQTFVTDQSLTVENYDSLKANVESKQVAATQAIENLQSPNLNCEQDPADTTERGFDRGNIRDAKRAMEEYRRALKDLTEAVRAAYGGQGLM